MSQENLTAKTLSNVEEVKCKRSKCFYNTSHKDSRMEKIANNIFNLPETLDILYPLTVIPLPTDTLLYIKS